MKKVLYFLVFICSFQTFSQIRRIDNANWLLYNLIINEQNHIKPIDAEGHQISTTFEDISGLNQFSNTSICDNTAIEIRYNENSSSFIVTWLVQTLGGCDYADGVNPPDIHDIEFKFQAFFVANNLFTDVFNYEITLENLDTPRTLTITSPKGDIAVFHHSEFLSYNDLSGVVFDISLNPTTNFLNITINNSRFSDYDMKIIDAQGKIILKENHFNQQSINIEKLSRGLYFISITDNYGRASVKKFVK